MPARKSHHSERASNGSQAATRADFCKAHSISLSLYRKLLLSGLAPREINVGMGAVRARPRITAEAAAEWRAMMAKRASKGSFKAPQGYLTESHRTDRLSNEIGGGQS